MKVFMGVRKFIWGLEMSSKIYQPIFLRVWFAKTLADFEINDIAACPPLFCYNS